jgi:hypothetical protein
MSLDEFNRLPEKERAHFYRCPGCGEMADQRQWEEVRLHHDHVLHPEPRFAARPVLTSPAGDPLGTR